MARLRGSNVRECEGLKKREKLWKECVRFRGRFSLERGKEVEPWALAIEEWMRQRREREREREREGGGERRGRERERMWIKERNLRLRITYS